MDNADLLDGLNPEQLTAVTAPNDGALLVLAGAGCGKTAVLTRRIAFLARSGISADCICALTFSRKAAEEMAHRLIKIDPSCGNALVTTFHAFALRTLQEMCLERRNFNRIGFRDNVILLDAKQKFEILATVSTTAMRKALRMGIIELDSALSLLSAFPEKASEKWDAPELKLLTKINDDFAAVRRERGLWDFSDLIGGCLELFKKFPQIASIYGERYKAILVDEFQDTNPTQIELLEALLAGKANMSKTDIKVNNGGYAATLYAVGDDDQAIYGFRGADIRPIMNFTTRFKNAHIIKLQINYRSIPPILNCANKLWMDKPEEYKKTLVSGLSKMPSGCRKPQTMRFGTQEQALVWILGKARFIRRRDNIPISEMAILFRINDTLTTAAKHYANERLPTEDIPQLLTVHASKGLEYPVVFICDLEEGVFPHYKLPQKQRRINTWMELLTALAKREQKLDAPSDACISEELRLFYVGVTRAQRYLYFVTTAKKPFYGRNMNFIPSRFLKIVKG